MGTFTLSAAAANKKITWTWSQATTITNIWNANNVVVNGNTVTVDAVGSSFGLQASTAGPVSAVSNVAVDTVPCY